MDELGYWVGFNKVMGIGPARLRALLDFFGSVEAAWHASPEELREIGLDRRSITNLRATRKTLDLQSELDRLAAAGVTLLTWDSPDYPINLRNIYDPPPVIYVRGELAPEDDWAVALVGTRRATVYGKEAARQLATDLVHNGVTVVSGLAAGIDSVA
ncbi:MAG: DNA-protecting protein DprA, partial [Anaerolineae bacterium]|nr:DNA-protecting protein DprA [Anaerolineae bacterium]